MPDIIVSAVLRCSSAVVSFVIIIVIVIAFDEFVSISSNSNSIVSSSSSVPSTIISMVLPMPPFLSLMLKLVSNAMVDTTTRLIRCWYVGSYMF